MRTISLQEEGDILSRLIALRPQYDFSFWVLHLALVTDGFVPVIQTTIQCTVVHKRWVHIVPAVHLRYGSRSLHGKKLIPQESSQESSRSPGRCSLKLVVGVGSERRQFTEIAPFKAVGVDVAIPGADKDSFTLKIDYSASQDIGPLLLKALGTGLVTVIR